MCLNISASLFKADRFPNRRRGLCYMWPARLQLWFFFFFLLFLYLSIQPWSFRRDFYVKPFFFWPRVKLWCHSSLHFCFLNCMSKGVPPAPRSVSSPHVNKRKGVIALLQSNAIWQWFISPLSMLFSAWIRVNRSNCPIIFAFSLFLFRDILVHTVYYMDPLCTLSTFSRNKISVKVSLFSLPVVLSICKLLLVA